MHSILGLYNGGTISKECSSRVLPTVMFAYEQCLLVLGHHPDIWYEAAQYLEQSSKLLAEKGVSSLPLAFSSFLALTWCTLSFSSESGMGGVKNSCSEFSNGETKNFKK